MAGVQLLELGAGPLSHILKLISVQDVLRASQACRALHQAAQDDSVWHAKAVELYPHSTVRLEPYHTYQELVRDDNCEHAAMLLTLPSRSCRYKMNRPAYYFECLVLALEWHRAQQTFRLYIEARGEADLRQPIESSLGFMVHRDPPPDRRRQIQQLQELLARRSQLLEELAAAESADAMSAISRLHHLLLRNATQHQQAELELSQHLELSFADLVTVMRPAGQGLLVDREGHKLGYLEFESLHKIDTLLEELPDSYASKQQAAERGLDLCFCYGNPIPVMPHGAIVDYEPCIIASVPPGSSLLDAFKQEGCYCVPGQLLAELEQEAPEERRRRWGHLPAAVESRQPPWLI